MASLLDPGKIIALAHGAHPAKWGEPMSTDYPALVTDFLELLQRRQIPFVVVGGIALLQHVPGRNTEEIDLIISTPRLDEIPELSLRERTDMFAYGHFRDLRVDVRFAEHPVFNLVAREFTVPLDYRVGRLPTATIYGLILLKLFALPSLYRQYDFDRVAIYEADIMQLLSRSKREDRFFLDLLTPHALESDRAELARILAEIRGDSIASKERNSEHEIRLRLAQAGPFLCFRRVVWGNLRCGNCARDSAAADRGR